MSKFLAKVAFPDYASITVQVSPEDTCNDVKQRVVQKRPGTGYNAAEYDLAYEMVPLADNLVLSTKFVQAGVTVNLVLQKKTESSIKTGRSDLPRRLSITRVLSGIALPDGMKAGAKPEHARRISLNRLTSPMKDMPPPEMVAQQIEEWSSRKDKAVAQLASSECTGEARKAAESELDISRKYLAELVHYAGTFAGTTHISGYLVKMRTVPNVKWQKRFFTFNEGAMNYRAHPPDRIKLELCVHGAHVEQTSSYVYFEEQKYFRFVLKVDEQVFELGAPEDKLEHWVSKINANIALVTPPEFEVGEHCSAPWSDGNFYPAVIDSFGPDKWVAVTFPEYGESFVCQKSELKKVLAEGEERKEAGPMGQREVIKKDSFLRMFKSGKWTSKHFRLLGRGNVQSLQYFKDVASLKSLGTIPITAATTVECVNGGEAFSFHVVEKDQPPLLLCADSEALRADWLHAIAAIIKASTFGAMSWGLSLLVLYPPEELGKKELEAILDELEKSKEGTREELMARVREAKKTKEIPALDLTWHTVESTEKASAPGLSRTVTVGTQKPKEHVTKEGMLMKKGAVNTKSKPRHFKIVGVGNTQSLQYSKKKEDKASLGSLPICASTTVQLESGTEFTVTPADKRTYSLSASTEKEAKEWVTAIQNIIDATTPGAMSWSAALLVLYPPESLTEKELVAILEEGGFTGNDNLNKEQLLCKIAIMQHNAQEEAATPRSPILKPRPQGKENGHSIPGAAFKLPPKPQPSPHSGQPKPSSPSSPLPPLVSSPASSAPSGFKVGQQCFAPWSDGHYYLCTILSIEGDQVQVNFDEYGEQGATTLAELAHEKLA